MQNIGYIYRTYNTYYKQYNPYRMIVGYDFVDKKYLSKKIEDPILITNTIEYVPQNAELIDADTFCSKMENDINENKILIDVLIKTSRELKRENEINEFPKLFNSYIETSALVKRLQPSNSNSEQLKDNQLSSLLNASRGLRGVIKRIHHYYKENAEEIIHILDAHPKECKSGLIFNLKKSNQNKQNMINRVKKIQFEINTNVESEN